jgi:hypothetical protein
MYVQIQCYRVFVHIFLAKVTSGNHAFLHMSALCTVFMIGRNPLASAGEWETEYGFQDPCIRRNEQALSRLFLTDQSHLDCEDLALSVTELEQRTRCRLDTTMSLGSGLS